MSSGNDDRRRRRALAAAGLAVWDHALAEDIIRTGAALETALGLPRGGLNGADGEHPVRRMHPDDAPAYRAMIEAARRAPQGAARTHFRLRRADGAWRWFSLRGRLEDGRFLGVVAALDDGAADDAGPLRPLTDALTGLPAQEAFFGELAALNHDDAHLLLIDIARFQAINDAWGMRAGDRVLKQLARRLSCVADDGVFAARLPGDRFALLLRDAATPSAARRTAARIGRLLEEPCDIGMRQVRVGVRMGLARVLAGSGQRPAEAFRQAEVALSEARRHDRPIVVFDAAMQGARAASAALEQDLRTAVANGEIVVLYQPILSLRAQRWAGFEALARWRHPRLGVVDPGRFIALAEEAGLIAEIGHEVLRIALADLARWQQAHGEGRLFMSVNVSAAQLTPALAPQVAALVAAAGVAPGDVKLEVTESLLMRDPALARTVLDEVARIGVRVACDDFGTGHSSLASLRTLPFHTLKVDRAFVTDAGRSRRGAIILNSIIRLAHDLGLDVVAEGVETEDQLRMLANMDCDMAQGWLLGRPMAADQIAVALRRQEK
ncbi:MAG TPA: EAL domain-containing protein [Thermopetrobacter sp.]|nr:EAL domain-containing protein [Thermopetrobacter sp.]